MEYISIYTQGYNDPEPSKRSIAFDGKELRTLGVIPHQSRIRITKKEARAFKKYLDKIAEKGPIVKDVETT